MFTPPNCSNDGHMCGALKFAHTYSDAKNIPFGRYDRHLRQSNTPNLDFPPPPCLAVGVRHSALNSSPGHLETYALLHTPNILNGDSFIQRTFPLGFTSVLMCICCAV